MPPDRGHCASYPTRVTLSETDHTDNALALGGRPLKCIGPRSADGPLKFTLIALEMISGSTAPQPAAPPTRPDVDGVQHDTETLTARPDSSRFTTQPGGDWRETSPHRTRRCPGPGRDVKLRGVRPAKRRCAPAPMLATDQTYWLCAGRAIVQAGFSRNCSAGQALNRSGHEAPAIRTVMGKDTRARLLENIDQIDAD